MFDTSNTFRQGTFSFPTRYIYTDLPIARTDEQAWARQGLPAPTPPPANAGMHSSDEETVEHIGAPIMLMSDALVVDTEAAYGVGQLL